MAQSYVNFSTRLTPELDERVNEAAKAARVSKNQLIVIALEKYLEKEKGEGK